jgi:hypothetical protein
MQQFAVVVKEIRTFLTSFKIVRLLQPYQLHILFGALGLLFLEELLRQSVNSVDGFNTMNTIFYDIPLHLIAFYGFYVGAWLALIGGGLKYLPYGLWGYAFLALFPFESLTLFPIVQAAIYAVGGYFVFRYVQTSIGKSDTTSLNA